MASGPATSWTFLTSHARVLLCIADDPAIRLREIGERVGYPGTTLPGVTV
jgi:hypothetical protein